MQAFACLRPHHLARAVKRAFGERPVDLFHQGQIAFARIFGLVIKQGMADGDKSALTAQTEFGLVAPNHYPAFIPIHRLTGRPWVTLTALHPGGGMKRTSSYKIRSDYANFRSHFFMVSIKKYQSAD
jgi:hypothetical protein